jgi:hypothetical protein
MHTSDGQPSGGSFSERWKGLLAEIKSTFKQRTLSEDAVLGVWFLWATNVLADLPHMQPRAGFPPPDEVQSWVAVRQLSERRRKPRTKLKPSEAALLIDVGDWLIEHRSVEWENAMTLTMLLQAASIFAHAHGDDRCAAVLDIYAHIKREFPREAPALNTLPKTYGKAWGLLDRDKVIVACLKLTRDEDLVPTWFMENRRIPPDELAKHGAPAALPPGAEKTTPPAVGDLFDDANEDA